VSHSETTAAPRRIFKFPSLGIQILIALALGILVGTLLHDYGAKTWVIENILNPAGKVLITMIKMIVVPIVISTLTVGIAGGENTKELGKMVTYLVCSKDFAEDFTNTKIDINKNPTITIR